MNTREIYAHTLDGRPSCEWEPLYGPGSHAERVERCLMSFSSPFSPEELATQMASYVSLLGLVHDMGKASTDFQQYLRDSAAGVTATYVDHKKAGAKWAVENCGQMGKLMAYALHGHHSGLPNGRSLFEELKDFKYALSVRESLPESIAPLTVVPDLAKNCQNHEEIVFSLMLAVRMLHSCLVDADWLATELFREPEKSEKRNSLQRPSLSQLSKDLERYLMERESTATGKIDALRCQIHHSCYSAATLPPGVFRLNVPTGGGKTLSSLSFALAHACQYGLQRVIYVIPYTSIIEQTAQVFRDVLGIDNVLEHHSNIQPQNDSEANRYAVENWDAPIIVTTSVQFFESLYAARNSRCRKIHNIANSVVIFDEAQSLPCNLLDPCLRVMKGLRRLCGCSLVLCTATQPALEYREKYFEIGLPSSEVSSLIGEEMEQRLVVEMKRVEVKELGRLSKEELLKHYREHNSHSALFVVNLTRQARELFELLASTLGEGVFHLSARMCPKHRSEVLASVGERLELGLPTVLVATRVVEAGVDISFPVVYRDACGLDSLAQASGRCNRHGENAMGLVFSYTDADNTAYDSMPDLRDGIYAADDVRASMLDNDIFAPNCIQRYFQLYYSKRRDGTSHWDKGGIRDEIGLKTSTLRSWNFPEIEKKFQMIPDGQRAVFVCYDDVAQDLSERLRFKERLGRLDYQMIQQYSVNVYEKEWDRLIPYMKQVHAGADIWMLSQSELYSCDTGLLREPVVLNYIF